MQSRAAEHGVSHFLVSVDNTPIHGLQDSHYQLGWPANFLSHPAYSPDLHQIEHRFAELKQYLVNRVYQLGFDKVLPKVACQFVIEFVQTITPAKIRADIQNLISCYKVVAAAAGQFVTIGQKTFTGVDGAWPPKGRALTVGVAAAAPSCAHLACLLLRWCWAFASLLGSCCVSWCVAHLLAHSRGAGHRAADS